MKLSERYKAMNEQERERLASDAGISAGYLWQLATGWIRPDRQRRVLPSMDLLAKLAACDEQLTVQDMAGEFTGEQEAA